jgi:hypothetical protein
MLFNNCCNCRWPVIILLQMMFFLGGDYAAGLLEKFAEIIVWGIFLLQHFGW